MSRITVDKELCKSCGLCVLQCPKKILRISTTANSKGYYVCEQIDATLCIACNFCAYVCPMPQSPYIRKLTRKEYSRMSKHFIKGNEAIAEAAVRAGCRFYAGYPITPQSEVPEILSVRLPQVGGNFIQGESEIASVYMVYGVAATGIRSMTSSSGPGLALKAEGISFLAAGRIPAVIVNVVRGGPAIGTIMPSQQDYFSATKAPAPGGFRCFVLAPQSVQEVADLVYRAFDYADKYRTPVMVLADGMIGNMMESIELPPMRDLKDLPSKEDWRYNKYNDDGSARVLNTYSPTAKRRWKKTSKWRKCMKNGMKRNSSGKNTCWRMPSMCCAPTVQARGSPNRPSRNSGRKTSRRVLSDPLPWCRFQRTPSPNWITARSSIYSALK